MGWIEDYTNYCSSVTDSPLVFGKLCGIHILGCVMGRNFYHPLNTRVYHNTYIGLIAKTSRARKTTIINMMKKFLRNVGFKMLSSDITKEALIKALTENPISTLVRDEIGGDLEQFAGKGGYLKGLMDFFCDIWDEYDIYTKDTISRGTEEVKEPYFNMFMATTETRFNQVMKSAFILSGWLPRYKIYFMTEADKRPYKDLFYPEKVQNVLPLDQQYQNLLDFAKGVFGVRNEIKMEFMNITKLNERIKKFETNDKSPFIQAFLGKAGAHLIKIAGIFKLSDMTLQEIDAADFGSRVIYIEDDYVDRAYLFVRNLIRKYRDVVTKIVEWGDREGTTVNVLEYIEEQQKLFLKGRIRNINTQKTNLYGASRTDKTTLDMVLETLSERGEIKLVRVLFTGQTREKDIYVTTKFFEDDLGNYPRAVNIHCEVDIITGNLRRIEGLSSPLDDPHYLNTISADSGKDEEKDGAVK